MPCILEGIPVFCGHESTIPYKICNTDFSKIEEPLMLNRMQFFNDLGYAIWNINEFKNGTLWNRIENYLDK